MTNYNERLDEILDDLVEGCEDGRNPLGYRYDLGSKAKQAIIDWHRKQVEEVLDRLESMAAYDPSGSSPVINPRQIEAERKKLIL